MYPVSSGYLDAVRSKVRTDRLLGSITLSDGTEIPIDDSVLVKDTLKLTRELCRGSYRIGTFSLACLQFSFFLDDAVGIDLTGAYTELEYGILVNGVYEDIPLGKFLIDPVLSIRRKDILSIVAYDEGVLFDVKPSDTLKSTSAVPAALIAAACAECGVATDITAQTVLPFPNASLTVCAESSQIQTCRDLIMWCASLMCCYAMTDRDSKLVLIPAKYAVDPHDSSIIITDRTIRADERESITVTDTRAYIKYLTAYSENDVVNYTSSYISQDEQASPAAYVLEKNPLLEGKSAADCNAVNTAWLGNIDSFKQRGVRAVIFGDPAIDPGDTIIFRGGDVDQRSGIIGVVTGIEWRYRGADTIECLAAECVGRLTGQSSALISANVRRQSSKRIDNTTVGGGSSGVGEDIGNHSERFNDYTYNEQAARDSWLHIEGKNNKALGGNMGGNYCTSIGGEGNRIMNCKWSDIHGNMNTVSNYAYYVTLSGSENEIVSGSWLAVSGYDNTITNSNGSTVGGQHNTLNGADSSIVAGEYNTVSGDYDVVVGYNNTVTTHYALVGGQWNTVSGSWGLTAGQGNLNNTTNCGMFGQYGEASSDERLVVGNGSGTNNRSKCFYVNSFGEVYASGGYHAIGADYAEYFEWADGNPDGEDRRGMPVQLIGDKIAPAHGDDILGVVSCRASVIGNAYEEHWHGKYKTDVFGAYIPDKDGRPQLSDDYDPERKYIPRSQRQEWAVIGLVGRLIICDNGKCEPGGYVSARQGVGAPTFTRTNVRCLKRIDNTHIEVLLK